ncbi:MAG: Imm53 family immunity protein [Acidimicrobiales bacterium]|nr:Imm53 family immunity protein [Acidimicrobiales bacterium]
MDNTGAQAHLAAPGDVLAFLCDWYRAQCVPELHDGDGITIEAVDGPGWWLTVDLRGTALEGERAEPFVEDLGEGEWVQGWSDGTEFVAAASASSLPLALRAFRDFVRDSEAPQWERLLAG